MSEAVPIAFYAPLKPPDHPVPSGDRRMALLFLKALTAAGFEPWVASRLRSHDKTGDRALQQSLLGEAREAADRLCAQFRTAPPPARPRLWFTYHCYYKAPDLIGPCVASALDIPYVVAEGSRAPKRRSGAWELGHAAAEASLDRARTIFIVNETDRQMLEAAMPAMQSLVGLPPFIDDADFAEAPRGTPADGRPARLLAVAMMRHGDKLASYRLLAEALQRIAARSWSLDVVGDGDARAPVRQAFAPLGAQVTFHGLVEDPQTLSRLYAESDLLVWPAVNEAYGMVLLEAQRHGCPVVAGAFGGVPNVVRHGSTGLLATPNDADALSGAIAALLDDPSRRCAMGEAARAFVTTERTVARAAAILHDHLMPLVAARS